MISTYAPELIMELRGNERIPLISPWFNSQFIEDTAELLGAKIDTPIRDVSVLQMETVDAMEAHLNDKGFGFAGCEVVGSTCIRRYVLKQSPNLQGVNIYTSDFSNQAVQPARILVSIPEKTYQGPQQQIYLTPHLILSNTFFQGQPAEFGTISPAIPERAKERIEDKDSYFGVRISPDVFQFASWDESGRKSREVTASSPQETTDIGKTSAWQTLLHTIHGKNGLRQALKQKTAKDGHRTFVESETFFDGIIHKAGGELKNRFVFLNQFRVDNANS